MGNDILCQALLCRLGDRFGSGLGDDGCFQAKPVLAAVVKVRNDRRQRDDHLVFDDPAFGRLLFLVAFALRLGTSAFFLFVSWVFTGMPARPLLFN